ncbi:vesicle-associated membrane protein 5 [Hyperolius riggenbachi]|uniref:vesicle-associated membrane protein 5 n=1 Tax=Hyperolius riggenbachi TaxID=752182 RepID=UPI0035A32D68
MATRNLEACQKDTQEITLLMKNNVDKVFEREGKLENLEVRSEELKSMASNFQKTAQTVERKTRWEKWRWYIIGGIIIVVIVAILIIIVATQVAA